MRIIETLVGVLLVLLSLPLALLAYLYIAEPVVAARYVGIFTSEQGDYSTLVPRMSVTANNSLLVPTAADTERTIAPQALAAMRDYAADHASFSLLVIHKGSIQLEWYAEGWDRQRPAQSQSMHKSLLPVLLQAAIEDGYINSLTDPVGLYIEEWANDPRGNIAITEMLAMASGLRAPPFSVNPFSKDFLWLFGADVTPILLRTPLARESGTQWDYNNIDSELMGLIIERATGRYYADYLAEKLWNPIGAAGAEVWLDSPGGKAHSSCCLIAPPLDWAKFGLMLLNRGSVQGRQIVSREFIDSMTTPAPTSEWYGYQIWLSDPDGQNPWGNLSRGYQRTEPFLRDDTFYTSGFGGQRVYVVPSEELVIVRMGPATGPAPVRPDWDNAFLVNTAIRNLQ